MALASLRLFPTVKTAALIAMVALLALPTRVLADPQEIYASPNLPPGADLTVLNQLVAAAKYTQTVQMANQVNIRKQPSSFSACMQQLLKEASAANNLFAAYKDLDPTLASISPILQQFATICEAQLATRVNEGLGEDIGGPHTVQNGLIAETSITNLMGSTGDTPVLSIPRISTSSPAATALANQLAQTALVAYQQALANQVAAQQADAAATAANTAAQQAALANPTAANTAAASTALAQQQAADATVQSTTSAVATSTSSTAVAISNANGGASPGDGSYDNIDVASNSMGVTLSANSPDPQNLLPVPDSASSDADDTPPPGIPLPPTVLTYDNPDEAPQNATVCISPSNRSDLDYATATEDSDGVPSSVWNVAQNGLGDADDLESDPTKNQTVPMQATSTIVPQPNSPNPGDKPNGQPSQVPAGIDGVPGCAPFAIGSGYSASNPTVGKPGITATGMPCTANTNQSGCMAGSGCSSQNGKIGYAKDYQSGTLLSHGPYGSGGNKGACAQLSQTLVPNLLYSGEWRKGNQVYNNKQLQFGTPVATFFGPASTQNASEAGQPSQTCYRYEPNGKDGHGKLDHMQHTGLFMGYTKSCMFIFEEAQSFAGWGSMPHLRCMEWGQPWNGSTFIDKKPEMHNAMNYHIICNSTDSSCPRG